MIELQLYYWPPCQTWRKTMDFPFNKLSSSWKGSHQCWDLLQMPSKWNHSFNNCLYWLYNLLFWEIGSIIGIKLDVSQWYKIWSLIVDKVIINGIASLLNF